MRPKKVGLVAHDVAPCQAFELLAKGLTDRDFEVIPILLEAGRKSAPTCWNESLAGCDAVVIGMSSSPELAQSEISAAQWATDQNVPFGFYADTFGVETRQWFETFRRQTRFVFVLNYQNEVVEAQTLFPQAVIFPSGNPTHELYFSWPTTREEIRHRVGFKKDDFVVLVPGGKSQELNLELLGVIQSGIYAAKSFRRNHRVVFSLHPGDKNKQEEYERMTRALIGPSLCFSVLDKNRATTADLLCGTDLVFGNSPSLDVEAACKRISNIFYLSSGAQDILERGLGRRDWPPCNWGASLPARGWWDIYRYLSDGGKSFKRLKICQTQTNPDPCQKGESVKIMIDALSSVVQ